MNIEKGQLKELANTLVIICYTEDFIMIIEVQGGSVNW